MTIAENRTRRKTTRQRQESGIKKMKTLDSLSLLQHNRHSQDSSPLRAINTVKFLRIQSVSYLATNNTLLNHVRDAADQCTTRADERLLCQPPQSDIGRCPLKLQALQHRLKCACFPYLGPFDCWQALSNLELARHGTLRNEFLTYLSVGRETTK